MPMLAWRMVADELFQPLGHHVPAESHEQVWREPPPRLFVHRIEQHVGIGDAGQRQPPRRQMLSQPNSPRPAPLAGQGGKPTAGRQLPHDDHRPPGRRQTVGQPAQALAAAIASRITGDGTLGRQPRGGEVKQRFADRHVDVHRAAPVMHRREQRFVDQPVAMPLILGAAHLGQVDRHPDQAAEDTRLWQRLPVELPYPGSRPVGRDDQQRHALVVGFRHRRMQVDQRRA